MMETQNSDRSKKQYSDYSQWKKSYYFGYIEGLWCSYIDENLNISFIEYVQKHNHNSLETATSLIEIWKGLKIEKYIET
jgi:hypothetical protein